MQKYVGFQTDPHTRWIHLYLRRSGRRAFFFKMEDHWGYFFCLRRFLQQILPCDASFIHLTDTHTHTHTHTQVLGEPPLDIDTEPLLHTGRYTQEKPFCTCLTHSHYLVGFQCLVSLRSDLAAAAAADESSRSLNYLLQQRGGKAQKLCLFTQ